MQTQLLIIRHGNTFEKGQTPRRVGARTDLPLSSSGKTQMQQLGLHLKSILPSYIKINLFSSPLLRTLESAQIISQYLKCPIQIDECFKEIDYGIDENQDEASVVKRIGQQALEDWDKSGIPAHSWLCNPTELKHTWQEFADNTLKIRAEEITLVLTSNGCARFAPVITARDEDAPSIVKLKTAHYMLFTAKTADLAWTLEHYNQPYELS